MQNGIFTSLAHLSDEELAAQLKSLAARDRDATARMVAHLAEMDNRDIHLRAGYPRLYDYCLKVLHLSEWEAWNRIEAGHVARRFPILLDMLEEGSINITGIKLLGPHLTPENHRAVLDVARWKSKLAVSEIVARLDPQPDVPMSIIPIPPFALVPEPSTMPPSDAAPSEALVSPPNPMPRPVAPAGPPARPTVLTPLSPQRYKLQVTISSETLEKLRRAKDMLGHSVPARDDDAILNRALTVLIDLLAREKFAQTENPRPARPRNPRARRPPAAVVRIVWQRDGGRCKYTAPDGHRCEQTRRVEPHHLEPWALAGSPDNPDAYELRCQRHNDYEGRLYFGKRRRRDGPGEVREQHARYAADSFRTVLVPEQIALGANGEPHRGPRAGRAARRPGGGLVPPASPRRPLVAGPEEAPERIAESQPAQLGTHLGFVVFGVPLTDAADGIPARQVDQSEGDSAAGRATHAAIGVHLDRVGVGVRVRRDRAERLHVPEPS